MTKLQDKRNAELQHEKKKEFQHAMTRAFVCGFLLASVPAVDFKVKDQIKVPI